MNKRILKETSTSVDGMFSWRETSWDDIEDYMLEDGIEKPEDFEDILMDDSSIIEKNLLSLLKKELPFAREEGHDEYGQLVGSIECDPNKVPNILYPNNQDDVNYYSDTNTIMVFHLNEWVGDYEKELLKGTSEYGFYLITVASLVLSVKYPTKVYFDELT